MKGIFKVLAPVIIICIVSSCGVSEAKPAKNLNNINNPSKTVRSGNFSLELVNTLNDHNMYVFYVDYSPDGKMIASGSADKNVIINDCSAWKILIGFE